MDQWHKSIVWISCEFNSFCRCEFRKPEICVLCIGIARGDLEAPPNRDASKDKFVTKKAILAADSLVGLLSVREDLFLVFT